MFPVRPAPQLAAAFFIALAAPAGIACGALALAIVQSESPTWQRGELTVAAAVGVMALIAFVVWARVTPHPLVDLALFKHRTYRYVNLATLSFGIAPVHSLLHLTKALSRADALLYEAKQAGRNRVHVDRLLPPSVLNDFQALKR